MEKQVSSKGKMSVFQTGDVGSIPTTCSYCGAVIRTQIKQI